MEVNSGGKLISLIRKEESVWNNRSTAFTQRHQKQEAWLRIAQQFTDGWNELSPEDQEKTIADLKKKWNNMRDYYRKDKAMKRVYYSRRQGQYVARRKYVFCDMLSFLDPTLKAAKEYSAKLRRTRMLQQRKKLALAESNESSETLHRPIVFEDSVYDDSLSQNSQTSLHVKHEPPYDEIEFILPESNETPPQPDQLSSPSKHENVNRTDGTSQTHQWQATLSNLSSNPNVAFLLSCSQEMDEMTPYQRIEFKSKVLNLIKTIKYPAKMEFF